jgi:glycosyltransferase involved in cell wall biosynthesis
VFCADLLYRYVAEPASWFTPEIRERMAQTFLGWRHARAVFATTPRTASDVVSFAGVPGARVRLLPTLIDPPSGPAPPPRPPGETILWVTNATSHKNHARTLAALRRYWDELGGRFDVVVCGAGTEALRPGASDHPMAQALSADPALARRFRILGRIDDATYLAAVADSGFVLHNALMDNGTFAAFDAARAGRHFVSSDYPSMRYLAQRYGIDTIWYPPRDVAAMAASLARAEAALRAGEAPRHQLRADDPAERLAAYQALLHQVLA